MMANFDNAIMFVLNNEGGFSVNRVTGEVVNHGITLKWLQTVWHNPTVDTIRELTEATAIVLYEEYWWNAGHFDLLPSDRVATKVFDGAINMGRPLAVGMLQSILSVGFAGLAIDGVIGPKTAAAMARNLTTWGEDWILARLADQFAEHYKAIASRDPRHKSDLAGWLRRAARQPSKILLT